MQDWEVAHAWGDARTRWERDLRIECRQTGLTQIEVLERMTLTRLRGELGEEVIGQWNSSIDAMPVYRPRHNPIFTTSKDFGKGGEDWGDEERDGTNHPGETKPRERSRTDDGESCSGTGSANGHSPQSQWPWTAGLGWDARP